MDNEMEKKIDREMEAGTFFFFLFNGLGGLED